MSLNRLLAVASANVNAYNSPLLTEQRLLLVFLETFSKKGGDTVTLVCPIQQSNVNIQHVKRSHVANQPLLYINLG